MSSSKQKKQLIVLSGLLVLLLASFYYALRVANAPAVPPAQTSSPSQKKAVDSTDLTIERTRRAGKKTISLNDVDPTIHLEKIDHFAPGTPLNARNMFSFEAPPSPTGAGNLSSARRSASGAAAPSPATMPGGPVPVSPAQSTVPMNLKFYGFKIDPVGKARQGFFTEGDEMFLASEGDLVANRYRILKIGESSAEVEDMNSRGRRQLQMVTQ